MSMLHYPILVYYPKEFLEIFRDFDKMSGPVSRKSGFDFQIHFFNFLYSVLQYH